MTTFNAENYNVLYHETEITILTLKRPYFTNPRANQWSQNPEIPPYVFLFRDELIPELYNNPMLGVEGHNLVQLVASAYKEMFYHHFQRGEVWKGRALERGLSMMFVGITAQSLYEKCNATHWVFKVGPHHLAGGTAELNALVGIDAMKGPLRASVMGTRFLRGDTPSNGKQTSTVAIAELTVNAKFIWAVRGNSRNMYPLEQLKLSVAAPFSEQRIPTFGEIVTANADKIRQFVG